MRRTGRIDINGREICEGDVVNQRTAPECSYIGVRDPYKRENLVVGYDNTLCAFTLNDGTGASLFISSCEYEIIDNPQTRMF